ncbi:MAG: dethiobiotin synthase [Desulfuromonas sp.]|uniref:dethiobiotin synthase n=1 Tax=Desulfuromonas sp. TaxID=892 RepID=UPI000CC658CF|nr:dethiobiotin synthase [Desulfuromonas sp.]PLX86136.1 MAG: dethiobiotin synthase [Desulfuromonas sp.]
MPTDFSQKGIFVTGTDTGVGKTLVSAALALFLRGFGIDVGVMKPVETGVDEPAGLGEDATLLQWAAKSGDAPDSICPCRLRLPLAPSEAASREGAAIDLSLLQDRFEALAGRHDFVIVEGAGGLMVPIAGGVLMADLARNLGLPLLVVARPGLGTINHTLLTVFAARTMELPLAGMIINGMPNSPDEAEQSAPHALAALASADLLGVLPRVAGEKREMAEALAKHIAALPSLFWLLKGLGLPTDLAGH